MTYAIDRILLSQAEIEARAKEIGEQITEDYAGRNVVFVGILTGSVLWMAQVLKSVALDTQVDFMSLSSYGAATHTSGVVKIIKDLNMSVEGRDVIIVEDIVDSGLTLDYLKKYFAAQNVGSLAICTMLDKPSGRRVAIKADYVGFEVPGEFLVGYGLDVDQRCRNLPYIASVLARDGDDLIQ
ncbi:MAG: hypoxanthine phosphoribosyltransferase [Clostridiales bacterium]|nr:hypoxanthine phosphoribosyltransferase [Clostridiales bacterium]